MESKTERMRWKSGTSIRKPERDTDWHEKLSTGTHTGWRGWGKRIFHEQHAPLQNRELIQLSLCCCKYLSIKHAGNIYVSSV